MAVVVVSLVLVLSVLAIAASLRSNNSRIESVAPQNEAPETPQYRRSGKLHNVSKDLSALLPRQFVVLDLETTGLNRHGDEIIEIGAIRVSLDSDNHATFQTLVRSERKIPKKITQITGITQEMIDRDGIHVREALVQFGEFIGELPLVTFNAEFDMAFLHNVANKHGVTLKNSYTCALKRARRAWPGLSSYRLSDLAQMGKLETSNAHRALGDCQRALIVFTSATSVLGQKVRWTKPQFPEADVQRRLRS
jgi:DNA polymerase III epsilon subunit family exonuclease